MTGVILCGGKSMRMGADKGLLRLQANTWAQTAVDKIAVLHLPVFLSVNEKQYDDYAKIFDANHLVADDNTLGFSAPLGGLLSVHKQFPAEDLVVLACDMPLMESSLIRELYDHYQMNKGFDAYIYGNDGEPEPLCGIYTAKGLSSILNMLLAGKLKKYSMKFMLEHLRVLSIPIAEDYKKCFRNFNAHAELNGL